MAERRLISSLLEAVAERLDTFDTVAAGANAPDPVANKATENNDDRGDIMLNAIVIVGGEEDLQELMFVFCVLVKRVRMSHSFLLGTIILKKDTCLVPASPVLALIAHASTLESTIDKQQ